MEYNQPELYAALASYVENERSLIAEAEKEVAVWKYASEEMQGPLPLNDVIGVRVGDRWHATKQRWFNTKPEEESFEHGFDQAGRLRIIKGGYRIVLFVPADNVLNEIHLRGKESYFHRHILNDGITRVRFGCYLQPLQYEREEYEFIGGRCTRCVTRSFYLESKSKQWVEATWTTIYRFEYDDEGLLSVYRDMGAILGDNVLLYRRPGSDSKSAAKIRHRRPMVAYSTELPVDDEERNDAVYSNAYGLEMTIDDEYPVDTVILTPPELVSVVTQSTGVTSMGTVFAGSLTAPVNGDFKQLATDGAKWLLIDAGQAEDGTAMQAALDVKLDVILRIGDARRLPAVVQGVGKSKSGRMVIAIGSGGPIEPNVAQAQAAAVRRELLDLDMAESRIILAAPADEQNVMNYFEQEDIDGLLVCNTDFGAVVGMLRRIGLHSS
jgi:hypothetical protein